jgi:hypothetical protein
MSEDRDFIKAIWKSAHSVQEFPGKVTIRRFSPYKKVCVVGEGATESDAWRNAVKRVEKVCAEQGHKGVEETNGRT